MAKHNAHVDVRGDLRVRGRVEDNLRVKDEVEAAAFYIRGVGELLPSSDHGSLSGLTDDDHPQYVLVNGTREVTDDIRFRRKATAAGFYLSPGSQGISGDLLQDSITFQIQVLQVKNYFLDGDAPFSYIVDQVSLRSESGGGEVDFYINPGSVLGVGRYGSPIAGLRNFYISRVRRRRSPTVPVVVNPGNEFFMGVISTNGPGIDVVGTVSIRRSG